MKRLLPRLVLVKEVLVNPLSVFEGWSRPDTENCYVYAGDPKRDHHSLTIDVPAPPNQLFLVFILPDGTIDLWIGEYVPPGAQLFQKTLREN